MQKALFSSVCPYTETGEPRFKNEPLLLVFKTYSVLTWIEAEACKESVLSQHMGNIR
jgi:hypothetical protein